MTTPSAFQAVSWSAVGQLFVDDERVVSGRHQGVGKAAKESLPIVADGIGLPVNRPRGATHAAAVHLGDRLVAEADAEHRQALTEVSDGGHRDARLVRRARAGRDDQMGGPGRGDLVHA